MIQTGGIALWLGSFYTEQEAASVYNEKYKELYGIVN